MYLGKERRNRFVALGLAAVLVAGVVLALLATVATASPTAPAVPAHPGGLVPGDRSVAAGLVATGTVSATSSQPAGHHDAVDPAELASTTTGHPGRLVGVLVAVALLLTCGVMVVHEQRRRRGESTETPERIS